MKLFLFILFFLPLAGNTQTSETKIDSLQHAYNTLADSLSSQRTKIVRLLEELEVAESQSVAEIAVLRKENEALRQILIGYVKGIDELNNETLRLETELEDCKKER